MIADEERSTATGKGRSAGGAFALPVSPKGKEGLCGCPDGMHQGTDSRSNWFFAVTSVFLLIMHHGHIQQGIKSVDTRPVRIALFAQVQKIGQKSVMTVCTLSLSLFSPVFGQTARAHLQPVQRDRRCCGFLAVQAGLSGVLPASPARSPEQRLVCCLSFYLSLRQVCPAALSVRRPRWPESFS